MEGLQWSKILRFIMILVIIIGSTGCDVGVTATVEVGLDAKTRQVLEDAIKELGNWPGQWEATLNAVVEKLGEVGSQLAEDVRIEVQTLVAASTQILQEATFCQIDFIGIRAKQHMQYILHKFFPDADPVVFTPVICTAKPTVVQSDKTSQVEYSGFDFVYFDNNGDFKVDLVYGDNGESIKTNFGTVNIVTNYHIVVDIQGVDYTSIISSRHPSLVMRWNSDNIEGQSEVPVNIVLSPIPPTPTVYEYEIDYCVGCAYWIFAGGSNPEQRHDIAQCPRGSLATGFQGRQREFMSAIGVICSVINSDGTTGEISASEIKGHEIGAGPIWSGAMCPPNKVLTGINGVYDHVVDRIQGICSYVNLDNPDPSETGWSGEGGADFSTVSCEPGYFIGRIDLDIYYGEWIAGLTITCFKVVRR